MKQKEKTGRKLNNERYNGLRQNTKNKSKDKFADEELSFNTEKLFEKLEDSLKNSIYKLPSIESIEENQIDIIKVKNAIKTKTNLWKLNIQNS